MAAAGVRGAERAKRLAAADLAAARCEYIWGPKWLSALVTRGLHDPRDAPAALMIVNALLLALPAAAALHAAAAPPHWLGVLYLVANYATFLQVSRFVCACGCPCVGMCSCMCQRQAFSQPNTSANCVAGPTAWRSGGG